VKKEKSSSQITSKKKSGGTWLLVAAVVVFGGVGWFALRSGDTSSNASQDQPPQQAALTTQKGALSPLLFSGKIRQAYQVAMDIPDILKQIACYCGCKEEEGHKSNFDCFTDQHGVNCEECQNIALDTKTLHDAGYSVAQIQEAVRIKYAP